MVRAIVPERRAIACAQNVHGCPIMCADIDRPINHCGEEDRRSKRDNRVPEQGAIPGAERDDAAIERDDVDNAINDSWLCYIDPGLKSPECRASAGLKCVHRPTECSGIHDSINHLCQEGRLLTSLSAPEQGAAVGAYRLYTSIFRVDIVYPINYDWQHEKRRGHVIGPEQGAIPGAQCIHGPIL